MTENRSDADTAAAVLAKVRSARAAADAEEARILKLAVDWAAMHSTDSLADSAMTWDAGFGQSDIPVAGPGAPLVAEFCVPEFAAAVGLSTDAGGSFLGEALELRHRLPRVWRGWSVGTWWRGRPGGSPGSPCRCRSRLLLTWTSTSPMPRTRSGWLPWTGRSPRRWRGSCPRRPRRSGRPPPTAAASTSRSARPIWAGPSTSGARSMWRMRWISTWRCPLVLKALKTSARPNRWTSAAPRPIAGLARHQLAFDLETGQPTSARPSAGEAAGAARPPRRWCGRPVWRTPGPRSRWSRSTLVHPGRHPGDREADHRPQRPPPRRGLRGARPDRRTIRPDQRDVCLPVVHPVSEALRLRPHPAPRLRRNDIERQHRAAVQAAPPPEDPWRVALPTLEAGSFLWHSPHGYTYLRDRSGTADVTRDRRPPPDQPPEHPPDRQP